MNIFLLEDEDIHIELAKAAIEESNYNLIGYCKIADCAIENIKKIKPDIVLVDIALPGKKNGIDIGKIINTDLKIPHIFTTSFKDQETIIEAIETNPISYLIKPITSAELIAAIELSKNLNRSKRKENSIDFSFVFVKIGNKQIKLIKENILWIEASGQNYLDIHTIDNKTISIRSTLTDILKKLNNSNFIQTHRSYAINLKHLEAIYDTHQSALIKSKEIPIGRKYKKNLMSTIVKI